MLTFAYDRLTRDGDGTQVEVLPNCQWPDGDAPVEQQRFSCATLVPLCVLARHRLGLARTDALLRSGAPFVYPLELRYNLRESFAVNPDLAPGMPTAVLDRARAGRAVILVWIGHEQTPLDLDGVGQAWVFDVIQKFVVDHGLPPSQVWFVSGNVAGVHVFAQWLRARRLYELHAFRFRTLAMSIGSVQIRYRANAGGYGVHMDRIAGSNEGLRTRLAPMSREAFAERYIQPAEIADERLSGRLRPKRFLSMNSRPRFHRQLIVTYLAGKGLLDDSLVSFPAAPLDLQDGCAFPLHTEVLRAAWRTLHGRLPLHVDRERHDGIDHHEVVEGWPYRQSYFNLVSETEVGVGCSPFSTEKVAKPMLNYQPFILISTAHTLRYLYAIGFKGFPGLIDQAYDQVENPVDRMARIFEQIDCLGQIDQAEARERYFACLPELEHNRAHLIEGRHELGDLLADIEVQLG
jgi:hypothetical protein